jgi:hypothetical protein
MAELDDDLDAAPFIGDFEARRVERFLHEWLGGRLRGAERLRVSGGRDGRWRILMFRLEGPVTYPLEARVEVGRTLREADARALLLDLQGMLMEGYLADRSPRTGTNWEQISFEGHNVWVRGQEVRPGEEQAASELLAADAVVRSRRLPTGPLPPAEDDAAAASDDQPD